jgi:hypothetical protein
MSEEIQHLSFPKIQRLENLEVIVTEKLDGTNAVIYKETEEDGTIRFKFGSRNRWLGGHDEKGKIIENHGFFQFCSDNLEYLMKLSDGYHYGEFIGPGINRGYFRDKKMLFLFDTRLEEAANNGLFGPDIRTVPVLAENISLIEVMMYMKDIKDENPELMSTINEQVKMEGVMLYIPRLNQRIKVIFDKEHNPQKEEPKEKL